MVSGKRSRQGGFDPYYIVYISSVFGDISSIDEFTYNNFGMEVKPFDFDIGIKSIETVDWLTKLVFLYEEEDEDSNLNFSIFHRPPTIWSMESSKFLIFCGAGIGISILIPLYFLTYGYIIDYQQNKLSTVYKHKMQQVENLKAEQDAVISARAKVQKDIEDIDTLLEKKSSIINQVLQKSQERRYISQDIFRIVDFINRHGINTQKIDYKKNLLTISLVSKQDMEIASLIKDLSLNSGFKKIFSRTIYKDNLTNTYFCDVEIVVDNE